MKKFGLLSTSAIFSTLALAVATPAMAQNTPTDDEDQTAESEDTQGKEILVTGSRIRRPNIDSPVPIVSVTNEDLTAQGDINVGDALNDLPSLRSTYSQANSTRFIGTTGLNLLDLRGLGITRTLVLVNGRRHITALPGDFIVDTNTIPTDLIERVDVITGGSSAIYGSDAVAGVVNFVLKRDFDGMRVRAQGGISDKGDRGIYFVSGTFGKNFADGRGNVAVNLEYVNAEALYFKDRPNLTGAYDGRCQMQLAEFATGEPAIGDGVADNQYFCGVRNAALSEGGTFNASISAANCQSAAFGPSGLNAAIGAARCINPGTIYGQPKIFRFGPGGSIYEDTPSLDFRPFGSGNYIANPASPVQGSTLRGTGQLAPGLDRYTANVLAHFDVSDAFRPFFEGKYVHIFSRQEGQPSFFSSVANTIGLPNPTCDNAYIDNTMLAKLQSVGYCSAGRTTTQTIPVNRFNVDFGGRSELVTRDTYRFVGGVEGDFNDDWHYEVSATYGRVKIHQDELNDLVITDAAGNLDGFSLAYNPVMVGGVPTCREWLGGSTWVVSANAACRPLNIFGEGSPSAAALGFINTTSWVSSKATELDVVGYVQGDMSQLFELPGGPIKFVVGAEYRRETASQTADARSAAGGTFFNAFSNFNPPAFKVLEGFGEIEIPLLKDMPFFQELTFSAAARYSDYNTPANKAFSYNLSGVWAPVSDIRFRGNYSQSVRVPTMSDLYSAASQNFAFIADPCDVLNIGPAGGQRQLNCAAQGIPAGYINTPARTASTGFQSAGNPFLSEETSKSLTLGAVITPRWIPGLSLTVDYYDIKVNNLIAVLGAQTIMNLCYDLPQPNGYCPLLNARNPDFTFADPALISAGVNFAKMTAKGFDVEVAYRRTFDNGHRLNMRFLATRVTNRMNYVDPTNPAFADRQLSELGDPKLAMNLSVSYGMGGFDLRYNMNYIGRQTIGAYENYFPVQGRPGVNQDSTAEVWYPEVIYHSIRGQYKVNDQFRFYGGVDNLFDKKPPLGVFGTGGGDPYDSIGRYFYIGAQVDF